LILLRGNTGRENWNIILGFPPAKRLVNVP
jgi:hypothetical protein